MTSTKDFMSVFQQLINKKSNDKGFQMLKANYHEEGRKISALKLANAAGYKNYGVGNSQYGRFARKVCELLGTSPNNERDGKPIWTYALCDAAGQKDEYGHFQWILKKEVAEALENLDLVSVVKNNSCEGDINSLKSKSFNKTENETIAKARLVQQEFKLNVIEFWKSSSCAITGCTIPEMLIASHIKPWVDSTDVERVDGANGLILCAHLDKLFDNHLVTFIERSRSYVLVFNKNLVDKKEELKALNINEHDELNTTGFLNLPENFKYYIGIHNAKFYEKNK